jgi:hypothetical protein
MARGPSGRLVVDIEPDLKRELHASLAADGLTFKDWVISQIHEYLDVRRQPTLPGIADSPQVAAEDRAPFNLSQNRKS